MSKSNKKTRRFLKRLSDRKGIDYRDAIASFYGTKVSEIDNKLLLSLMHEKKIDKIL